LQTTTCETTALMTATRLKKKDVTEGAFILGEYVRCSSYVVPRHLEPLMRGERHCSELPLAPDMHFDQLLVTRQHWQGLLARWTRTVGGKVACTRRHLILDSNRVNHNSLSGK